jgi:hypothetical protein
MFAEETTGIAAKTCRAVGSAQAEEHKQRKKGEWLKFNQWTTEGGGTRGATKIM